ncbi:NAD(P)/FAD-dependent oxidoreductase [Salsipaludibacter albus]|uniref:NAD(P)/FAD-dependent oxidoreductase n=1 Tax=Salsipaludibacter albus TaxID=2849650 RepID=UPI001EE40C00|nr:NAD(P)/FAD-dependent oxidoreductase [Salsipaludibacter albus]MBY5164112.1 NAD(P)/FAD-dependent oxidoreductase [Salsipaludibacter albus]
MNIDGQHVDDPEVVVIGGGPAGLASALVLARSDRQVVVVDAGRPRNATAEGVHSFPTREGTSPAELLALGRADVERYGGRIVRDRVVGADLVDDGVVLALEAAAEVRTRRVVLTTGLVDRLPDVAGLADHWGRDVVHCPFCHGHEVSGRRIGVLATNGAATHQAMLFHHLADELVLLRHRGADLDEDLVARLVAAGVKVQDGEVVEVLGDDSGLAGVRTADGATIDLGALVVAPRFAIDVELVGQLGLEPVDHPSGFGQHVPSGMGGTTTAPQVRVAGNVTDPMAQVVASMAQGNLAGAHLHATLLQDDLPAAA